MIDQDLTALAGRLGLTGVPEDWHRRWAESVAAFPAGGPKFLEEAGLREFNRFAELPGEGFDALLKAAKIVREDDDLSLLLWHCRELLYRFEGSPNPFGQYIPDVSGRMDRSLASCFTALVLFSEFRDLRRFYAERDISDRVFADTFSDAALWFRNHREKHGRWGLDSYWLFYHFTGKLFTLGRLMFGISRFNRETDGTGTLQKGDEALDVHIPQGRSLKAEDCDASFREAESFFPRTFPDFRPKAYVCESWLLDPRLAKLLPETSNIVRFQRRFAPYSMGQEGDQSFFERVFGFSASEADGLDRLPRDTALRRAVLAHLRAGGRLYDTGGTIPYPVGSRADFVG